MNSVISRSFVRLMFAAAALASTDTMAQCISCSCDKKLYNKASDCTSNCKVSLGCFTAICAPVSFPSGAKDPDFFQRQLQGLSFPNLRLWCSKVTAPEDPTYNCLSFAAGFTDRLIDQEVDLYGDKDGIMSVADFDAFFINSGGYQVAKDCSITTSGGKHKIALYADEGPDPVSGKMRILNDRYHVATQAAGMNQTSGPWFESKEGGSKRAIHRVEDLDGGRYGKLIKCYEK